MTRIIVSIPPVINKNLDHFKGLMEILSGFDGFILTDSGWGVNCLVLASQIISSTGGDVVPHLILRDKNRIAVKGDLVSCEALNIKQVIISTGLYPMKTPFPDALPVYDLDLRQALKFARQESNLQIGAELYLKSEFQRDLAEILVADGLAFMKVGIDTWQDWDNELDDFNASFWWDVRPGKIDQFKDSLAGARIKPETVIITPEPEKLEDSVSQFDRIREIVMEECS